MDTIPLSLFSHITVKALLSPRGAYLISDLPEGGLIERGLIREGGAYLQNQRTRIYLIAF